MGSLWLLTLEQRGARPWPTLSLSAPATPNTSVPSIDRVLAPLNTVFPQQKSSLSSKTQLNGPCSWKHPDSRGASSTHFPWYIRQDEHVRCGVSHLSIPASV